MPRYRIAIIKVIVTLFSLLLLGNFATAKSSDIQQPIRIGFHFYKPGKIYDEAYQGVIDGLQLADVEIEQVIFRSGRDQELARQNLLKMDQMNLAVIVSFSSAGTRIAKSLKLTTPVLASVINHPISLGISSELPGQNSNISGTSYYINASQQLSLYVDLFPELKRVGMIYDANNPAGYLAEEPLMKEACVKRELLFISKGATGRSNVAEAAAYLLEQQVDVIVIPTNLQIYNNLDIVLEITNSKNIPVVSMNKQGVEAGAIAALYADTYKTGRHMVNLIQQIVLQKRNASRIPFYYTLSPDLIINLKAAAVIDYEFRPEVLGRASIVLN